MTMSAIETERRLERLEDRVLRVERHLGMAPVAGQSDPGAARGEDLVEMRRQARERTAEAAHATARPMAPPPLPARAERATRGVAAIGTSVDAGPALGSTPAVDAGRSLTPAPCPTPAPAAPVVLPYPTPPKRELVQHN